MFKPTVMKLIEANKWAEGYHEKNLCSRCEGSSWSTTLHGSPNTGTIQDDLRAFLRSLNPEAEPEKQADVFSSVIAKSDINIAISTGSKMMRPRSSLTRATISWNMNRRMNTNTPSTPAATSVNVRLRRRMMWPARARPHKVQV